MFGLRRRVIFPRHALRAEADPHVAMAGREDIVRITRRIENGDVEAWLLRAPHAGPRPVAVFAHGNGELIDHWPDALAPYLDMGISVLLPEYRGYGRSAGRPSEEAIAEDFAWFVDRVRTRPDVDAERVLFHGRSIGGGVVGALARKRCPDALVLWSTFTSLDALARRFGVPALLVPDHFRTDEVVRELGVPTLVVHGTQDSLIPIEHGEQLAVMTHGKLLRYEVGHNDCPPPGAGYWRAKGDFLREIGFA